MSLLRTKIQLPPLRVQHVQRERVLRRLVNAPHPQTRLILVSAPAGFGKSSCLVEWGHQLRKKGALVAWYALDEHDNDPVRFGTYLLGAFQQVSSLFQASDYPKQMGVQETIYHILNTVGDLQSQSILILDDYHLITDPQIHDAVGLMTEYLPENMCLALGTRADPPLPLARLRTQGLITEVRVADLRFQKEEVADWLQAMLGWIPSERLLKQLDGLTEGWAVALALILMNQSLTNEQTLENQLVRYSLTQRHIFDYFAQEVYERQSEPFKAFLLDTCVLDGLNPEVCTALTGRPDAPLILNQLATGSLFIVPLSETEPLYRYHHLFEQFLRQGLELTDHARYLHQHYRASQWHEAHDNLVEAVQHCLAAQNFDSAAQLIETRVWETLTSRGEITTILNWLTRFTDEVLKSRPRLCLYFSRALYLNGDVKGSRHYLELAAQTLKDAESGIPNRQALQTIAFNYQATLAAYQGDIEAGRRWIEQANAQQHTVDALDRVRIANTYAFLHYLIGNVSAARGAYQSALEQAEQLQHHYLMLDAHYYLAQTDLLAGKLDLVEARCQGILTQYYPAKMGPLSALMLPLAAVYYQRNRIIEAEATLREAIALARRKNIPDLLWFAHLNLAEILLARGEFNEVEASMAQAQSYARGFQSPIISSVIGAAGAHLALRLSQLEAGAEWAAAYQTTKERGFHRDYEDLTLARIWLAQGKLDQALAFLEQLIASADTGGRLGSAISAKFLQALAYQAKGQMNEALSALEPVLVHAEREGFVRLFLDAGPPALKLLRLAVDRHIVTDYAAYLLDAAAQNASAQHPSDTLTEREIDVLKYIAAGASNQAIADAFVISLGTVKSHIHHIMNKLNAQNRTEAVSKARSLHILAD